MLLADGIFVSFGVLVVILVIVVLIYMVRRP